MYYIWTILPAVLQFINSLIFFYMQCLHMNFNELILLTDFFIKMTCLYIHRVRKPGSDCGKRLLVHECNIGGLQSSWSIFALYPGSTFLSSDRSCSLFCSPWKRHVRGVDVEPLLLLSYQESPCLNLREWWSPSSSFAAAGWERRPRAVSWKLYGSQRSLETIVPAWTPAWTPAWSPGVDSCSAVRLILSLVYGSLYTLSIQNCCDTPTSGNSRPAWKISTEERQWT